MPIVKTLSDRVEKFKAKTPPDQTGTRYGAVKDLESTMPSPSRLRARHYLTAGPS